MTIDFFFFLSLLQAKEKTLVHNHLSVSSTFYNCYSQLSFILLQDPDSDVSEKCYW